MKFRRTIFWLIPFIATAAAAIFWIVRPDRNQPIADNARISETPEPTDSTPKPPRNPPKPKPVTASPDAPRLRFPEPQKIDFDISAATVRAFPGGTGMLNPSPREANSARDPSIPFNKMFALPGQKSSIAWNHYALVLDWTRFGTRPAPSAPEVDLPSARVDDLENGAELELVAFATWFPSADDPLRTEIDDDDPLGLIPIEVPDLKLRRPDSLKVISADELMRMGVPEHFRQLLHTDYFVFPRIRLVFRSKNMDFVKIDNLRVGDARTNVEVASSQEVDWIGGFECPVLHLRQAWHFVDLPLRVWHDTPVTLLADVLTGTAEIAEFEGKETDFFGLDTEQRALGDQLRMQWMGIAGGAIIFDPNLSEFEIEDRMVESMKLVNVLGDFESLQAESKTSGLEIFLMVHDPVPTDVDALFRTSSFELTERHCAILSADGTWLRSKWRRHKPIDGVMISSCQFGRRDAEGKLPESVKLVYLPHLAEMRFEIAGLPDAPNPSDIDNLFDARIPRVTLLAGPFRANSASDTVETQLLQVVASATETRLIEENSRWQKGLPRSFPKDRTFRNTTPRELAEYYLNSTIFNKPRLEFNENTFELIANPQSGSALGTNQTE